MRKESRRMAVCGILAGFGVMIMLLGGAIPLATFCCPALAGIALIPIREEYGARWTLAAYAVITALSLLLSPDKESALLFAFLGWYPAAKPGLDRIPGVIPRLFLKLFLCDLSCIAMMLLAVFVLDLRFIYAEYMEMGRAMLIAFIVLANVTLALYDVMLSRLRLLYLCRIRTRLFRGML